MSEPVSTSVWATLALVILFAKLGGEAALRLKEPAVLGELVAGIVLGNLPIPGVLAVGEGPELAFAAELGVMLLLFQVGLESSLGEMVKIAPRAGLVAVIGVVLPSLLGAGASRLFLPDASGTVHLFVGATLAATSVGITASVLKELGVLDSAEARIILGAAVIDDVLGLVVLSIVSALATTGALDLGTVARISGTAVAFIVVALAAGLFVVRGVYRVAAALRAPHVLGALSIGLCLLLGAASRAAGLAAIVGAYAAGLLLDDVRVHPFGEGSIAKLERFVAPIGAVFAPVFFVRTGMSVHLGALGGRDVLFTLVLVAAAVIGKLAAGLGARGREIDRVTVGLGMIPRGEVGLIFASAASGIAPGIHTALVATVLLTTVLAPPALAWRIRRRMAKPDAPRPRRVGTA